MNRAVILGIVGGMAACLSSPVLAQSVAGSYQGSCRNAQTSGGALSAECRDRGGQYHQTSLAYGQCRGDISNNNGVLICSGGTGTQGPALNAPPQEQRGDNRRDRGRNDGDNRAALAGVAGLAAGVLAAQGQPIYQPGYRYPTYGDQHYGDPRFDPRYGPDGYGAGRQDRGYISIADRRDWLNRRIDRARATGELNVRQAARLRAELQSIERLEYRYRRSGMTPGRMRDLDRRFDMLAAKIRYERTH